MKRVVLKVCFLLWALGVARGATNEQAVAGEEASSWQRQAVVELDLDEFDSARRLAKTHRPDDRTQAKIILMAADLRQFDRQRDKQALASGKTLYKELADEVTIQDAMLLSELLDLGGRQLPEYTGRLLDTATSTVKSPEDIPYALSALEELPDDKKPAVIHAIGTWLASERDKVNQGRALSEEVQAAFTNQALLETLVDHIQQEAPMQQKAMDMLPEKVRRIMSSATETQDAADCLILIESPALPLVQEKLPQLGPAGVKLEQDIRIAISTREIRYPGSSWHTANPKP